VQQRANAAEERASKAAKELAESHTREAGLRKALERLQAAQDGVLQLCAEQKEELVLADSESQSLRERAAALVRRFAKEDGSETKDDDGDEYVLDDEEAVEDDLAEEAGWGDEVPGADEEDNQAKESEGGAGFNAFASSALAGKPEFDEASELPVPSDEAPASSSDDAWGALGAQTEGDDDAWGLNDDAGYQEKAWGNAEEAADAGNEDRSSMNDLVKWASDMSGNAAGSSGSGSASSSGNDDEGWSSASGQIDPVDVNAELAELSSHL